MGGVWNSGWRTTVFIAGFEWYALSRLYHGALP